MYRVPSEFIKQKNVLFWFVTVEHVIGAFGGYLLAQALGGATVAAIVGAALGLAVTTVKVQGLTLYRFLPLAVAYLVRKLSNNDLVEPDSEEAAGPGTQAAVTILDEQGRPIVFQED